MTGEVVLGISVAGGTAVVALGIGWWLAAREHAMAAQNARCIRELLGQTRSSLDGGSGQDGGDAPSPARLSDIVEFLHNLPAPIEAVRAGAPGIVAFVVAGLAVVSLGVVTVVDRFADRDEVRARCGVPSSEVATGTTTTTTTISGAPPSPRPSPAAAPPATETGATSSTTSSAPPVPAPDGGSEQTGTAARC